MGFDWKSIVGTVAPTIATALGGPLAGVAVKTLASAVLGSDEGDPKTLEKQVAAALQADPNLVMRVKEAEIAFQARLEELGVEREKIAAEDRNSARQREAQTGDSWTPRLLAGAVTVGFFGVLWLVMRGGVPAEGGEAMLILLGSLGTAWTGIIAYYFGSSAGSKAKDTALRGRP